METKMQFFIFIVALSLHLSVFYAAPAQPDLGETSTFRNEDLNNTDLYVIRAVVYEVGILTDEDNSTDASDESHEAVELTFYDPQHNGSLIDLSNIPVPVQTNVSGQVITGLAPVNLGSIQLPMGTGSDASGNETEPLFLPAETNSTTIQLHNALVSVTTNLSTTNSQTGSEILQGLPPLLNLPQQFNNAILSNSSDF